MCLQAANLSALYVMLFTGSVCSMASLCAKCSTVTNECHEMLTSQVAVAFLRLALADRVYSAAK